jgi:hypothetical protein
MNTPLSQKSTNLYLQLSALSIKMPKIERYSLGLKLDNFCLALIEDIIMAEQTLPVFKDKPLQEASVKCEILKIFLRLALEKKLIKETNYFAWSADLVEIGKMIGGWRKSLHS